MISLARRREPGRVVGDVMLFWHSAEHRGGEIGYVFNPERTRATATPPRRAARCSRSPSTGSGCTASSPASTRATPRRPPCCAGSACGRRPTSSRTSGSRASGRRDRLRDPRGRVAGLREGSGEACARSASRSSTFSMPTDSRTRSFGTSSGDPATLACVIRPGCSISDSTPPSDSPSVNTVDQPADLQRGLLAAAQRERHHAAEVAHLPRGDVVPGVSGSPG